MIAGKRFLITQPSISWINGSTVATLELAEFLLASGADVTVYTWVLDDPSSGLFADINVVTGNGEELRISDFDYVWVHSQVLPLSFCRSLTSECPRPIFIYLHMSLMEECADERPFVYGIEEALASTSLFISAHVKAVQRPYFSHETNHALYINPAPAAYSRLPARDYLDRPSHVLIVSNHPPTELIDAAAILKKTGAQVTFLGESGDQHRLLTPDLISQYDLVVTIGKTVQYCLVAGIPVYIYDHFGGPGYLDELNYDDAVYSHFSGRNSTVLPAQDLVTDIVTRYPQGVQFQQQHIEEFRSRFLLSNVIPDVIANASTRPPEALPEGIVNSALSALTIAEQRFTHQAEARNLAAALRVESARLSQTEQRLRDCWRDIEDLRNQRDKAEQALSALLSSRRWKIADAIANLPTRLRRPMRKQ